MTTWLVLLVVGWIKKILYFGRLAFVFSSFDARNVSLFYNHAEMSRNTISPFNNHGPLMRPLSVDTFESNLLSPPLASDCRLDLRLGGSFSPLDPLRDEEAKDTNSDCRLMN
jgi:hypothetical protein